MDSWWTLYIDFGLSMLEREKLFKVFRIGVVWGSFVEIILVYLVECVFFFKLCWIGSWSCRLCGNGRGWCGGGDGCTNTYDISMI